STSRSRSIAPSSPPSAPTCASPTTSPASSLTGTAAVLGLLGFAAPARPAAGQARRFSVLEVGAGATVVAARSTFSGVELGIGRRLGSGLTRLAFGAAGGAYEGRAGMRLAATAQFLLRPTGQSGGGPLRGLGGALAGAAGARGGAQLVPGGGGGAAAGRPQGGFGEGGVAGGARAGL